MHRLRQKVWHLLLFFDDHASGSNRSFKALLWCIVMQMRGFDAKCDVSLHQTGGDFPDYGYKNRNFCCFRKQQKNKIIFRQNGIMTGKTGREPR